MAKGKGVMVWQLRNWKNGDVDAQLREAKELGLSWVSPKIAEGTAARWERNDWFPNNQNEDYLPEFCERFQAEGIDVIGWQFVYGRQIRFPYYNQARKEADTAVMVMRRYGITKEFWIDAEYPWKRKGLGMATRVHEYCQPLKAALPHTVLGLSSYRYPEYHQIQWKEWVQYVDIHAPQVYFIRDDRLDAGPIQLQRSMDQLKAIRDLPFTVVGPAYADETTGWRASREQLKRFLAEAKTLGLDGAGHYAADKWTRAQKLSLADVNWPVSGPPPPPPQPSVPLEEWAVQVHSFLRDEHGYTGPKPAV